MPLSSDVFVKQAWRPWVGLPFVYGDGDEHLAAVPTIVARMKWHPARTFSLARQRDVARAFELALTGVMDGRIVNIADDAPSTLYDMARGHDRAIRRAAEKTVVGRADGTLALSLGFKPTVPTLLQAVQQGILNKPSLAEIRRDLAEKIAAHTPARGENVTAVQGLSLFRQTACTPCYMASVEPSVSVFVQGESGSISEGLNTCATNHHSSLPPSMRR